MPAMSKHCRKSRVSTVKDSGYELVRRSKPTGKLATMRDYAKIDWKPWVREPGMGPTELVPSADVMQSLGVTGRLAYSIMLRTRDELIDMHTKVDHDTVDALMTDLADGLEILKGIAAMIDGAYMRTLAAACALQVRGGKFVIDGKLQRRRS